MSKPIKVWDVGNGAEEPDRSNVRDGISAQDAAEWFAEKNWSEGDYPDEQEIMVRLIDGSLRLFTVMAERTVIFRAREGA